jgi:uncharacterized coiled-coil protein SlyX
MMTTFNVMLDSRLRWRIIAALLLAAALGGCQALRLGYSQGPTLLYWWLDGYVDLTDEQSPRVREAVQRWFRWHRTEQLPEYAALLQRAQAQALDNATPAAMCAWVAEGRQRIDLALAHAVPDITAFLRTLRPAQIQHIEGKMRKTNKEFRDDNLHADRAERHKAALKRVSDRASLMYGRLDAGQREWLAHAVAGSPLDPERWYAERLARQQDVLQTLSALLASPQMPAAEAQAKVAALGERLLHSPRPEYRAYLERLTAYNCELAAHLHNRATPAQRRHARDKLKGWESDVRSLLEH